MYSAMMQLFNHNKPFELECGATLPRLQIAYHTYGERSSACDNVVWVCHALTANSDVADWWPNTVEVGRFLDPAKHFIVCANVLGSCYGTTGPLSIDPLSGEPYYDSFPLITVRDMVRAHQLLAEHLAIAQVEMLIGASIGGYQVFEWLVMDRLFARKATIIASAPSSDAWITGFNESQRMTIEADASYGEPRADAGVKGLAAARSVALLSYRGREAYIKTQSDEQQVELGEPLRVCSYQRYQGKKFVDRFNAYSYHRLTTMMDSHNIARGRGSLEGVLQSIQTDLLLVAITTDVLFPVEMLQYICRNTPNSHLKIIESDFGHDGFLVEGDKLNRLIINFLR